MDTLNFEQIGEKLKKIRLSKNLTQEYIANAADVNTSHISNIENNRVKVSLSVLVQICNALILLLTIFFPMNITTHPLPSNRKFSMSYTPAIMKQKSRF